MSTTSCVIRLEKDPFVAIRQSYVSICKEDNCTAALLNYYEKRHSSKMDDVSERQAADKRFVPTQADYLIKASNAYLQKALLGIFGRNLIIRGNGMLEELGFITICDNIKNDKGGMSINHVLFHPEKVNASLKGYASQRLKEDVVKENQRLNKDVVNPQQRLKINDATFKLGRNKNKKEDLEKEEEESAHTPIFSFEPQSEEKETPNPLGAVSLENKLTKDEAPPYLNANAQKIYKSHLEIYNTLVAFWKANPEYTETINLMIEPLGMGSQFPNKRKAFFDHVENIFCTSIKKNHKTPLSAFELHDIIVQKIAYGKAELSDLKPIGGKDEQKEKKIAEIKNKSYITEEQERIIVLYCQHKTGFTYSVSKDFRDCQDLKAQRIYLQATSNIENTKNYLIQAKLIAA